MDKKAKYFDIISNLETEIERLQNSINQMKNKKKSILQEVAYHVAKLSPQNYDKIFSTMDNSTNLIDPENDALQMFRIDNEVLTDLIGFEYTVRGFRIDVHDLGIDKIWQIEGNIGDITFLLDVKLNCYTSSGNSEPKVPTITSLEIFPDIDVFQAVAKHWKKNNQPKSIVPNLYAYKKLKQARDEYKEALDYKEITIEESGNMVVIKIEVSDQKVVQISWDLGYSWLNEQFINQIVVSCRGKLLDNYTNEFVVAILTGEVFLMSVKEVNMFITNLFTAYVQ